MAKAYQYPPTPMQAIWDALAHLPRLETVAVIRRGIEYTTPLKENDETNLISDIERLGFVKGLAHVTNAFEPYMVTSFQYLNIDPKKMRTKAYQYPWQQPKVIVNAERLSGGPWTITAALDDQGLVGSQHFSGIWATGELPLEVIAALLNGPVANAFISAHSSSRENRIEVLRQVPIPLLGRHMFHHIASLVRGYRSSREQWLAQPEQAEDFARNCEGIMGQMEDELFEAYHLDMHFERELVSYFDGSRRPGPFPSAPVELSPTKQFYTAIMLVEDVRNENGNKMIEVMIMNWHPHETVCFPASLVPENVRDKLERDVLLRAKVNVGARKAEDLFFEDIKILPEPKPYDIVS